MKRIVWCALLLASPALAGAQRGPAPFPHARHARLFPNCESCHAGVMRGDTARVLPTAAQCETCHNGSDVATVRWSPHPRPPNGLLAFSHPEHAARTDSAGKTCATCHTEPGAARMDVAGVRAARCFSCHTHRATAHFAEANRCRTCHVPLVRATALSVAAVSQLPTPATHDSANWVERHGVTGRNLGSCETCHARQSCLRCHLDAKRVAAIAALQPDPRVAAVVAVKPAVYFQPASHRESDFASTHGPEARREPFRCASCHARSSCQTCHIGEGASRVIDELPVEPDSPGRGRGVQLRRVGQPLPRATMPAPVRADTTARTVRVHPPDFERQHPGAARSGAMSCEGCHTQAMCSACHGAEVGHRRRFHVANFVLRHSVDAYSRETDCSSCHNTEAFCRSCHQQVGLGARGRPPGVFHTAQPQWLLQHGRAARQSLTTCTSCHQQRDCLPCHSTLGWGVSPHGPGFDAARLWKTAKPMCVRCHLSDPIKR